MIISVHLPKTAGSSFGSTLQAHFETGLLLDYGDIPLNTPVQARIQKAAAEAKNTRDRDFGNIACIHGHFLPAKYRPLKARGAVFVTWLREPLQRMVSHYNFWQQTYDPKLSHQLHRRVIEEKWSLEQFCFSDEMRNVYAQFFWSFPLSDFDFIGVTEHFEEDLGCFSRTFLGNAQVQPAHLNASPENTTPTDLSPGFRTRFADFHSEDYNVYETAVRLRLARARILPPPSGDHGAEAHTKAPNMKRRTALHGGISATIARTPTERLFDGHSSCLARGLILLTLAPHRSGTSLTARMLECLGAVNSATLTPANEYNRKGYFEDWDIYQFNENVLLPELRTTWHAVSPVSWNFLSNPQWEKLQEQAVALIRKNYKKDAPLSVLKEPRIAILLPFWLEALSKSGFTVKVVCVVRDPIGVVRSLLARDKLPILTGCLMYFRAWESVLNGLEGVASVFFDVQEIFSDPDATLRKIARVLDLPLPPDFGKRVDDFRESHLDAGLFHHKPGPEDHEGAAVNIPSHASQLYDLLLTCCRTQDVSAAKQFCCSATKEMAEILPYANALSELAGRQTQLQSSLDGTKRQIAELSASLYRAENELRNHRKTISDLYASTSWRITASVRWLGDKVKSRLRTHGGEQTISPSRPPDKAAQPSEREGQPVSSIIRESWSKRARNELDAFMLSGGFIDLTPRDHPVISVVQPVHNRAELTLACLRSLADCSVPLEVIVVDNASTDRTSAMLERIHGVKYIRNQTNMHFLAAANQGAREANSRHLLLLNNDTVVAPGAIEAALRRINSRPDIGAVGARLILPDGSLQEAGCFVWRDGSCQGYGRGQCPDSGEFLFSRTVDFCSGAFLLTPVSAWQELGGFDETYQPAYYEETDYCFRLWESGRTVVYEPRATVFHHEFGSVSRAKESIHLMQSHQALFEKRHREILSGRPSKNEKEIIHLRSRTLVPPRRILVYDERLPYTSLGSGFPRANQLLRKLAESGSQVTFIKRFEEDADTTFSRTDLPWDVEFLSGVYTGKTGIERVLTERHGYFTDFVISRPTSMAELRPLLDAKPHLTRGIDIIYDAEAIWSLREALEANLAGQSLTAEDVEARVVSEVSIARGVKRVLAVSPLEAEIFERHGFEASIVGHAVAPVRSVTSWQRRQDFLFVGAIHADKGPNFDSVMWFLREVWPILLSRFVQARFIVAGLNKAKQLTEETLPERVIVTGAVDDLSPFYDCARVFVAPTRAAAGIPLKVIEAAGRGLPVVATSLLVRQLGWKSPDEIISADTAEAFATSCGDLHADQELWQRQRTTALARVEREYSEKTFADQIVKALGL